MPAELALTWRRLGFPYDAQWKATLGALEDTFPKHILKRGQLPSADRFLEPAVLRGRMRALPLFHRHSRAAESCDRHSGRTTWTCLCACL